MKQHAPTETSATNWRNLIYDVSQYSLYKAVRLRNDEHQAKYDTDFRGTPCFYAPETF